MTILRTCPTPACLSFVLPKHWGCLECEREAPSFDPGKAIEAVLFLLELQDKPIEMLDMMHLIFQTDLEALRDLGHPITGARWFAIEEGVWSYELERLIEESSDVVAIG